MDPRQAPRGFVEWQDRVSIFCGVHASIVSPEISTMDDSEASVALKRCSDEMFDTIIEHSLQKTVEAAVCEPGCHRCCSINLEASWYEAWAIAIHVDAEMPEPERSEALERIEHYGEELMTMTSEDRLRRSTMCPFIRESDGMCSIYQLRPLLCRAHYVAEGGECGTGVPVNMLLAPKVAASIVDRSVSEIRRPPDGVDPFTEFITGVIFHLDRMHGVTEPRMPKPPLGHEIDDKIGPQRVIFDPDAGDVRHG